MEPAPNTKGRHALRWVLSVGLVFVVVVGMALQMAQSRADERWVSVLSHCQERELFFADHMVPTGHGVIRPFFETRGGNIFRAWRQGKWVLNSIVLRQERNFFGSNIEARVHRGFSEQVAAIRAVLAAVDVELVVEP